MSNEKQNNIIERRNIGGTVNHLSGDVVCIQDGRIFNRNHDRYFSAVIEEGTAHELEQMGCNVKWPLNQDGTIDSSRKPTGQIKVSSGPEMLTTVRMFLVNGDEGNSVNIHNHYYSSYNYYFINIFFFIGGHYYVKRKTKQHYRTR